MSLINEDAISGLVAAQIIAAETNAMPAFIVLLIARFSRKNVFATLGSTGLNNILS